MKYREIIFFITLKFIIGHRNMFEHTCHGILFTVMSVFKLKIQNDSKGFLNEFQTRTHSFPVAQYPLFPSCPRPSQAAQVRWLPSSLHGPLTPGPHLAGAAPLPPCDVDKQDSTRGKTNSVPSAISCLFAPSEAL